MVHQLTYFLVIATLNFADITFSYQCNAAVVGLPCISQHSGDDVESPPLPVAVFITVINVLSPPFIAMRVTCSQYSQGAAAQMNDAHKLLRICLTQNRSLVLIGF